MIRDFLELVMVVVVLCLFGACALVALGGVWAILWAPVFLLGWLIFG